ncbi:5-methylcytosine-specific restriction protein A [Pseudomonas migulae]|jgi:5-methylcytosine-specific restriction protein A|uniref:HNH endonuclease n=1 Tax=Pseudomonas migulae TaxID=78543 RepID=UPI00209E6A19|nr:HNH endonuclease signature motif containing protein [Pseudomonas migulae]MCP1498991.1 5-methylcytosine-specific restriction protein A [Pseudomonas migulae]
MSSKLLTKSSIEKAIRDYDNGERPFRYTKPKSWYIKGSTKTLYPLKYIYAMAIGSPPSSFKSSKPISEFPAYGFQPIRKTEDPNEEFERKVLASLKDPKGRAARLKEPAAIPVTRIVSTIVFIRNPDVVAEVLAQANGVCSLCNQKAPFKRKKDQSPYLEVHHRKRLADGGEDTVANAIAVCPNCHRKAHHG